MIHYEWKVHNNLCGSGHFPIIREILQPLHENRLPHWKITKANGQLFKTMCKQTLLKDPNIIDQTEHFTETLISIANETITKPQPQTNTALLGLTMTAEQLSAYLRMPYRNLIKNQPQIIFQCFENG